MLKVKDLLRLLQKVDPERPVMVATTDCSGVSDYRILHVEHAEYTFWKHMMRKEDGFDGKPCVILWPKED
jgi:hypothetical protein